MTQSPTANGRPSMSSSIGSDEPVGLEGGAGVLVEVGRRRRGVAASMNALSPSRVLSSHWATISARASALVGWSWTRPCAARIPSALAVSPSRSSASASRSIGVAVAAVLGEVDRVGLSGEGGEHAAGFDRGELVVVADEDDFGVGPAGVARSRASLRVPIIAASSTTTTEPSVEAVDRGRGRDAPRSRSRLHDGIPALVLELGCGPGGERAADRPCSRRVPTPHGRPRSAWVLPVPAAPTTTDTPAPSVVERGDHRGLLVTQHAARLAGPRRCLVQTP